MLRILIIAKFIILRMFQKNNDLRDSNFRISDPVDSYFECISTCDIKDGKCISKCVEILRENEH